MSVQADARVSSRSVDLGQKWDEAIFADLEAILDCYLWLDAAQSTGRVDDVAVRRPPTRLFGTYVTLLMF